MNFVVACFFSFIGSMTPGTINLSVLRAGLDNRPTVGIKMACAAAIVEYLYAWIAVAFEKVITSSPLIIANFQLVAAIVMLILGTATVFSNSAAGKVAGKFEASGFRRGIVLGVLNPLAMPYWIGVTAYLKSQGWVRLETPVQLHLYLLGVALGVFGLLVLVTYSAKRLTVILFRHVDLLKKIPGYIMIALGVFALGKWLSQ